MILFTVLNTGQSLCATKEQTSFFLNTLELLRALRFLFAEGKRLPPGWHRGNITTEAVSHTVTSITISVQVAVHSVLYFCVDYPGFLTYSIGVATILQKATAIMRWN